MTDSDNQIKEVSKIRPEQELVRIEKLRSLREAGFLFPNNVKPDALSSKIIDPETKDDESKKYTVAGRITLVREMGKAAFFNILDSAGKLQIYLKKDALGDISYAEFKTYDIGDIVEIKGYRFTTKTGEPSLHAESIRLLVKGLIPLPEKWHGLSDVEERYRHRYIDLISNPIVRETFKIRAMVIREIRSFLDSRDFIEVDTPVLQSIAGGANAKPFKTHHNSLGIDMFLRIATELPLKKCVVGGLERVYEIGRIFRNEGISRKHNPEFTSIEFYHAYATYEDLMNLTEELISGLVKKIHGTYIINYSGQEIDFTTPWPRVPMTESITTIGCVDSKFDLNTLEGAVGAAKAHNVKLDDSKDWGKVIETLWGELVEPKLINPTFITMHPYSISPLARRNDHNPNITDRFELIAAGMELANAFSELNDAIDQRERFENQAKRKEGGDEEAQDVDDDFLRALEYGMPPTAGEGIGIDRLVMLLTNADSIRDVLLFPQMKPEV